MSPYQDLYARFPALPLRVYLIGAFIVQVVIVAILVRTVSTYVSRSAVNDVTTQLQAEVGARIEQHLVDFLGEAHHLNQVNARLIERGVLDGSNLATLQAYFLSQIESFETPSSVYLGTPQGGLVGAGRELTGEHYVTETENLQAGHFQKLEVDAEGKSLAVLASLPDFDATTRPWYQRSIEARDETWSDGYVLFTGNDVAVAASRPVYSASGSLLGVVSTDISTQQLTNYLQTLSYGKTGLGYVMEGNGLLIASSVSNNAVVVQRNGVPTRIAATDSEDPLIRASASFLAQRFADTTQISGTEPLAFSVENRDFLIQVTPHRDVDGLEWLTVVVIPESDFLARIERFRTNLLYINIGIVLLSIVAATVLAQWMSRPMQEMHASLQQAGAGQWMPLIHRSKVMELDHLIMAYNQIVAEIQKTVKRLSEEVTLRRQTEISLRESEEHLSHVIEGANLGTWDWQVQGGTVRFNHRWAEMLGYTQTEILPRFESWSDLLHQDERDQLLQELQKHLRGETPIYHIEHRLRTKEGDWKWILGIGRVIERDTHGSPLRATGVHQDISERKAAEEALQFSHQALRVAHQELQDAQSRMMQQERLAAIGQLAAGIAHDFNNILTAILMYGEVSLREKDLSARLRQRLEVIVSQSRQAASLVQQILDFSRGAVVQMSSFNLNDLAERVTQLAQHTIPERITIQFQRSPTPLTIQADASRIQQALLNLIFNARDAMEAGSIRIVLSEHDHSEHGVVRCVECGPVHGGHWARVTVSDTGSGIASEHLSHIFEPFFTTKGPQGHGLGLAQVTGIVKQHGGHIEVETSIGQGTDFHLYFPLK